MINRVTLLFILIILIGCDKKCNKKVIQTANVSNLTQSNVDFYLCIDGPQKEIVHKTMMASESQAISLREVNAGGTAGGLSSCDDSKEIPFEENPNIILAANNNFTATTIKLCLNQFSKSYSLIDSISTCPTGQVEVKNVTFENCKD